MQMDEKRFTEKTETEEEVVAIRVEKVYLRRRRVTVRAPAARVVESAPVPALPPLVRTAFNQEAPPVELFDVLDHAGDVLAQTAVLGIDTDNRPLLLCLDTPDMSGALITGEAGAGKAALLRTMLLSLALKNPPKNLRMALIDPVGHVLGAFDSLPHRLAPLAVQPDDIRELTAWLTRELEARETDASWQHHIVVAVNAPEKTGAEAALVALAERGSAAGMHPICSSARPPAPLSHALSVHLVKDEDGSKGDFLAAAYGRVTAFRAAACSTSGAARAWALLPQG